MTPKTKVNDVYIVEIESDGLSEMFGNVSTTVTKINNVPQSTIDVLTCCSEEVETVVEDVLMDLDDELIMTFINTSDIDAITKMAKDNNEAAANTHVVNKVADMIYDDPHIMKKLAIAIAKKELNSNNE